VVAAQPLRRVSAAGYLLALLLLATACQLPAPSAAESARIRNSDAGYGDIECTDVLAQLNLHANGCAGGFNACISR
jgi:hypothetical protein